MRRTATLVLAGVLIALTGSTGTMQSPANPYARDARQAVDEAYTKKLIEATPNADISHIRQLRAEREAKRESRLKAEKAAS